MGVGKIRLNRVLKPKLHISLINFALKFMDARCQDNNCTSPRADQQQGVFILYMSANTPCY